MFSRINFEHKSTQVCGKMFGTISVLFSLKFTSEAFIELGERLR